MLNLWFPCSLFTQKLVFLQPLHHWCSASAYQQLAGGEFLFTTQDPPDWRQLHPPRSLGEKPEGYKVCCHLCGVLAWRLWVPETWISWFGAPDPTTRCCCWRVRRRCWVSFLWTARRRWCDSSKLAQLWKTCSSLHRMLTWPYFRCTTVVLSATQQH